jgi:transcriptional regulator with XRE-family HTH domain
MRTGEQLKTLTLEQVIERLKKAQDGKSLRALAKEIGVSPTHLSDIFAGKRGPGEDGKVLAFLKLVQNPVTYSEMK